MTAYDNSWKIQGSANHGCDIAKMIGMDLGGFDTLRSHIAESIIQYPIWIPFLEVYGATFYCKVMYYETEIFVRLLIFIHHFFDIHIWAEKTKLLLLLGKLFNSLKFLMKLFCALLKDNLPYFVSLQKFVTTVLMSTILTTLLNLFFQTKKFQKLKPCPHKSMA